MSLQLCTLLHHKGNLTVAVTVLSFIARSSSWLRFISGAGCLTGYSYSLATCYKFIPAVDGAIYLCNKQHQKCTILFTKRPMGCGTKEMKLSANSSNWYLVAEGCFSLVNYLPIDITCIAEKRFFASLPDISLAIDNKQRVVLTKDLIVNRNTWKSR